MRYIDDEARFYKIAWLDLAGAEPTLSQDEIDRYASEMNDEQHPFKPGYNDEKVRKLFLNYMAREVSNNSLHADLSTPGDCNIKNAISQVQIANPNNDNQFLFKARLEAIKMLEDISNKIYRTSNETLVSSGSPSEVYNHEFTPDFPKSELGMVTLVTRLADKLPSPFLSDFSSKPLPNAAK